MKIFVEFQLPIAPNFSLLEKELVEKRFEGFHALMMINNQGCEGVLFMNKTQEKYE